MRNFVGIFIISASRDAIAREAGILTAALGQIPNQVKKGLEKVASSACGGQAVIENIEIKK
ncbi:MAG: hypothetical protein R2850_09430 [Bacteroidia bacterium]